MILIGNALEELKKIESNSIDCIITSPPYYYSRNYGSECEILWDVDNSCKHRWDKYNFCIKCGGWYGQLGLEPDVDLYVKHLADIFDHCMRVLKNTGNVFLNIGDTYANSLRRNLSSDNFSNDQSLINDSHSERKNGKPIPIYRFKKDKDWIKPKQLLLVPYRLAIQMQSRGWIIRDMIVWSKKIYDLKQKRQIGSGMPESARDRLSKSYEVIIHAVKSERYYFKKPKINPFKSKDSKNLAKTNNNTYDDTNEEKISISKLLEENPINSKYIKSESISISASYAARRILKLRNPDNSFIELYEEAVNNVNGFLKRKLKLSGLSLRELSLITGISKGTLCHFFRTDLTGAAIPSWEAWEIIKPVLDLPEYEEIVKDEYKKAVLVISPLAYVGNVWFVNPERINIAHFSIMPQRLVEALLEMGCPEDGVVLDPFLGSGTVALVAERMGRRWVGIEINEQYVQITEERLKAQRENLMLNNKNSQ